jgi:predicted CopG family antitoxin
MPTLHFSGVPDDVYDRLLSLAQASHRSFSAKVMAMLERVLEVET